MLVLTRKVNEAILIQGGIRITVVEIRGDKVRLGVDAPRDVIVHRDEVDDRRIADGQPSVLDMQPGERDGR